jgi:Cu-Zn family superoxide dismutase
MSKKIAAIGLSLSILALLPAQAAELMGANGAGGTVTLTPGPKGVLVRIEAKGLPAGWHGVHFHEKGDCSDAKYTSAGAHVHAVTPAVHGLLNPAASDAGDLPNIFAAADGSATVELYSTLVTASGDASHAPLLDADGAALVIHANADDYNSQPIGGAGDRIACAVLK